MQILIAFIPTLVKGDFQALVTVDLEIFFIFSLSSFKEFTSFRYQLKTVDF